jgi:hypothetical protein
LKPPEIPNGLAKEFWGKSFRVNVLRVAAPRTISKSGLAEAQGRQ